MPYVVKEMALNLRVAKVFSQGVNSPWYSRKALWKHSLAVAVMSKMIYRREFKERGDNIYTIGLLHDIGIIAEDELMPQAFSEMLDHAKAMSSIIGAEKNVFGYGHDTVMEKLCTLWKFPKEMSDITGKHHTPPKSNSPNFRPAATLFISDYYCHAASLGFEFTASNVKEQVDDIITALGLKGESLDLILSDVIAQLNDMEAAGELFD
jgi:putative nucleotidyltransferase with HDIG domain